jgi:hypothetical protein
MVEPAAVPARRADQQPAPWANPAEPGHAIEEITMRSALLYYLTQNWIADRYGQVQHDPPARAASRARPPRLSPRGPRARELPAVVARRLRTVLGGSP